MVVPIVAAHRHEPGVAGHGAKVDFDALLVERDFVLTSAELDRGLPRRSRDRAMRSGALVRMHPGIYACGAMADEPIIRWRAALAYTRWRGALSSCAGLRAHGMQLVLAAQVQVVTGRDQQLRGDGGLVVTRRAGFDLRTADVRHGLAVLPVELCLLDAWQQPRLRPSRREILIAAVSDRWTTPALIRRAAVGRAVADRAGLGRLLELLAGGCQSELEIWGHEHVFTAPEMPQLARQHRVITAGATYFLDLAHVETKTAVELDGWRYHGSREQRDRDLRRDARLAGAGWLTLRYTHVRLHQEPMAVRREVLDVIAARSTGTHARLPA